MNMLFNFPGTHISCVPDRHHASFIPPTSFDTPTSRKNTGKHRNAAINPEVKMNIGQCQFRLSRKRYKILVLHSKNKTTSDRKKRCIIPIRLNINLWLRTNNVGSFFLIRPVLQNRADAARAGCPTVSRANSRYIIKKKRKARFVFSF